MQRAKTLFTLLGMYGDLMDVVRVDRDPATRQRESAR